MQVEDKNMGSWLKIYVVHYRGFTRTITIMTMTLILLMMTLKLTFF